MREEAVMGSTSMESMSFFSTTFAHTLTQPRHASLCSPYIESKNQPFSVSSSSVCVCVYVCLGRGEGWSRVMSANAAWRICNHCRHQSRQRLGFVSQCLWFTCQSRPQETVSSSSVPCKAVNICPNCMRRFLHFSHLQHTTHATGESTYNIGQSCSETAPCPY